MNLHVRDFVEQYQYVEKQVKEKVSIMSDIYLWDSMCYLDHHDKMNIEEISMDGVKIGFYSYDAGNQVEYHSYTMCWWDVISDNETFKVKHICINEEERERRRLARYERDMKEAAEEEERQRKIKEVMKQELKQKAGFKVGDKVHSMACVAGHNSGWVECDAEILHIDDKGMCTMKSTQGFLVIGHKSGLILLEEAE